MINTKSTVNVKIDAVKAPPLQPKPGPSTGEQLLAAIKRKSIPNITLPADENGYAFIDKDKHPELYEWAVRG
ncbi:MAG: hypothetical protein LBK57_08600 [Clostridiales Family XIII bacterium]|nr:hypothetical protein [Clostridiales Family XIII bacterium]